MSLREMGVRDTWSFGVSVLIVNLEPISWLHRIHKIEVLVRGHSCSLGRNDEVWIDALCGKINRIIALIKWFCPFGKLAKGRSAEGH